ncbi:MAG: hypothetical protein HZB51_04055 [Chloroflexi bacterium]|nr:hypothetical protein [Chloroflexota bacterium]
MDAKFVTGSKSMGQKIFLGVLLAAILLALLLAIPIDRPITQSLIAASWGNSVCQEGALTLNCPVVKTAASWGNKVDTSDSQQSGH